MSTDSVIEDEENGIELSPSARLGRILYRDEHNLKKRIKLFDDSMDTEIETDIDSDIEPEPTEPHLSSASHVTQCQIEFENESTINIYCYWIQYDSNIRKPPHCIYPSSSFRINTYITHPFILSTSDSLNAYNYDTIIAVYIPTNSKHLIHQVTIHDDLDTVSVNPFEMEEIRPSMLWLCDIAICKNIYNIQYIYIQDVNVVESWSKLSLISITRMKMRMMNIIVLDVIDILNKVIQFGYVRTQNFMK